MDKIYREIIGDLKSSISQLGKHDYDEALFGIEHERLRLRLTKDEIVEELLSAKERQTSKGSCVLYYIGCSQFEMLTKALLIFGCFVKRCNAIKRD